MVGSQNSTHMLRKFEVINNQISRRWRDNGGPSREICTCLLFSLFIICVYYEPGITSRFYLLCEFSEKFSLQFSSFTLSDRLRDITPIFLRIGTNFGVLQFLLVSHGYEIVQDLLILLEFNNCLFFT